MKNLITLAIVCCSFLFITKAQADVCTTPDNLLTNCGFETGNLSGWTGTPAAQLGISLGVDNYDAFTGSYGAYIAGNGSNIAGERNYDLLTQTVATVAGRQYVFSYDWAHITSSDPTAIPDDLFLAGINGAAIASSREVNVGSQAYTAFSYTFFATGTSTLVEFEAEDANFVFSVDDVSLVAAPEPASAALIGSALVALLLAPRLRKRQS